MDSSPYNIDTYHKTQVLEVWLGGEEIHFISKKGAPGRDEVPQSIQLLTQVAELQPDWRVLILGSGHAALGVFLGKRVDTGEVWLSETSFLTRILTAQTLQFNHVGHTHLVDGYTLPSDQEESFDCAILILPKGRKFAQRRLVEAWSSLRVGGVFYLVGANGEGIRSVIRDAEQLFGPGTILGYKKGNRVARFVKNLKGSPPPPWSREPGIARNTWFEFEADVVGKSYTLASLPGVFSYDRVDPGSKLLLSRMQIGPADRVLDLGCGWGILGLSAARMGAVRVDLVDMDLQAVAATAENILRLNLTAVRALPSDVLQGVQDCHYSLVVTNPPFHTGKAVDYEVARAFIAQSHHVLLPAGCLLLVANRFIRYEKLMRELYRQVTLVAEDNHYQLWSAIK